MSSVNLCTKVTRSGCYVIRESVHKSDSLRYKRCGIGGEELGTGRIVKMTSGKHEFVDALVSRIPFLCCGLVLAWVRVCRLGLLHLCSPCVYSTL
jgi:hypothetical protein